MIIKLNADQRDLLQDAYSSFLTSNTLANSGTITLVNVGKISTALAGWHLLIGELSTQTSEIVQITSVSGNTITLTANTKFSHTEGTRVYLLDYDTVNFYRNTVIEPTTAMLLGDISINPNSYFATYEDTTNEDGYAWYQFENSVTNETSDWSNPIPYTDFPSNSAYKIIDRFLEDLNDTEQKKFSKDLIFQWLSEGYADLKRSLNTVNNSYTLRRYDLTIVPGVSQYNINDLLISGEKFKFSSLQNIIDENGDEVNKKDYSATNPFNRNYYYIVNEDIIGFDPVPITGKTMSLYFKTSNDVLNSYWDTIELPDGNYYILNDYLLARSATKLNRPDLVSHMQIYEKNKQDMKLSSFRQDNKAQSFGFSPSSLA